MKTSKLCAVVVTVAALTVGAFAIDAGPAGRLWTAGNITGTANVQINDALIGSDWSAPAAMSSEWTITQNCPNLVNQIWGNNFFPQVLTPQFTKMAGTGYGSFMLGLYGPLAPTSHNPGYWGGVKASVMQIYQISKTSTSILGYGKAWTADTVGNTDGGTFVQYDRTGEYSGVKGTITMAQTWGWNFNQVQIRNVANVADITSNASNFVFTANGRFRDGSQDAGFAQLGKRVYFSNAAIGSFAGVPEFPPIGHDLPGIYYQTVVNGIPVEHLWVDNTVNGSHAIDAYIPGDSSAFSPIAAAKVKIGTSYYDATFSLGYSAETNSDGMVMGIKRSVDLNNDGDAMDAGESSIIYTQNSVGDANPYYDGVYDLDQNRDGSRGMQYVWGPNGKKFLMVGNSKQGRLMIVQLKDDGTFAGDGAANPIDYVKGYDLAGIKKDFAFDYYVPGDLTGDFMCNASDIYGFLQAYKGEAAFAAYNPNVTMKGADTNDDGVVNSQDIYGFLEAYRGTSASATVAPEPMTLALLGLGGLGLLRRSRK